MNNRIFFVLLLSKNSELFFSKIQKQGTDTLMGKDFKMPGVVPGAVKVSVG